MNRREFIQSSVAGSTLLGMVSPIALTAQNSDGGAHPFLELRRYRVKNAERKEFIAHFLETAAVPALNRAGVKPVGVFYEEPKANDHSIHVLLPYHSLNQFVNLGQTLGEDSEFIESADEYLHVPKSNPAFERIETRFLKAFERSPRVRTPLKGERIFELRTYQSYSELKGVLKVEMFNNAEIDLFAKVGLEGIFYGKAIQGSDLPSLTYMLGYKDKNERKKGWQAFFQHPDWHELSGNQRYADTVSKVKAKFVVPAPYSQV